MLAQTRIQADLEPAGFDRITALRSDTTRELVNKNVIQPGLLDTPNLASVTCEDDPGERLLVCCNPLVAAQRRRERNLLPDFTEADAEQLVGRYAARRYDRDEFNRRLGQLRRRMGKHFEGTFDEQTEAFRSCRKQDSSQAYNGLARVERAFRSMKSLLAVRPVSHWKERRVRAHLLTCMLAYYLEGHMRQRLAPLLFVDKDKAEGLPGAGGASPALGRRQAQGWHAADAGRRPSAV